MATKTRTRIKVHLMDGEDEVSTAVCWDVVIRPESNAFLTTFELPGLLWFPLACSRLPATHLVICSQEIKERFPALPPFFIRLENYRWTGRHTLELADKRIYGVIEAT